MGISLPVFVQAAGGGVVVDVDDNVLIDLGSGIAVTTIGNAAPAVVEAVTDQVARFTHTCFMITGYAGYIEVAEELDGLTPGDHAKIRPVQLRGRSGRERDQDRAAAHPSAGRGRVRSRLSRPDQPHYGADRQGDAVQGRLRAVRPGDLPSADLVPAPGRPPERRPRARRSQIEKQVGADNLAAMIIEPIQGEGGFLVPAPGFLPALAAWAAERRRLHRRRDPDRLRPHR